MPIFARLSDLFPSWPGVPALGSRLRTATTTIVAIGVVGVAILVAALVNAQANKLSQEVSLAIEIRERAERFLGYMRDAETGQRGYLLTGVASHLGNYENGRADALPELEAIAPLVEKNPEQKRRVDDLRERASAKLAELAVTVTLAREGKRAEAIRRVGEGDGVRDMEELRRLVHAIQLTENVALASLHSSEKQRRLFGSIGLVVALAGLAFAAWQQLRARQRRALSLAASNAALERKVAERTRQVEDERMRVEALLRDVSHRVGNNLAMVSALLNVQSRQSREPSVKLALTQAQARIQAIAAGQRRLRLDLETDEIDARSYMEDLLSEIGKAAEGRPITVQLAMDAIRLPGRDAVSFVVLVNELVTNAIKHAFPEGMKGTITISLRRAAAEDGGDLLLTVEDDGVGMPADSDSGGLGQTVIKSLLRSMRATMEVGPCHASAERPGTRVALVFPKRTEVPAEG